MNAKIIVTLLVVIVIVSIATGYVAGFYVYKEYKEKTAYLERRTQAKFEELEKTLEEINIAFENTIDQNRIETKEVLSRIEGMKESIEEWKTNYKLTVSRLRGEIDGLKVDRLARMVENLQDEVEGFKMTVQDLDLKIDNTNGIAKTANKVEAINVDLGKISVQKAEEPKRR